MRYGQEKITIVNKSIDEFRSLVNDLHRLVESFLNDRKKWYILCSAMDVIDHTEAAIKSYEDSLKVKDLGNIYLSVYGLFQVLVVQQDALFELFKVLDVARERNSTLAEIRDIRNDSSGHPVNRARQVPSARSSFFYSMDWDKEHFTLNRTYHDETPNDYIEIKPLELITLQRVEIDLGLSVLIQKLKERENEHRKSFQGVQMQEIFNGYGYCFEKVTIHFMEGSGTPFSIAKGSFKELSDNLKKFTDELEARGIRNALPGVTTTLDEIKHPLRRLTEYFIDGEDHDPLDMLSFTRHFEILIEEIIVMAKEIDESYSEEME